MTDRVDHINVNLWVTCVGIGRPQGEFLHTADTALECLWEKFLCYWWWLCCQHLSYLDDQQMAIVVHDLQWNLLHWIEVLTW